MNHQHPELATMYAQEQYRDRLAEVEQDRLAALARPQRRVMLRRLALHIGRRLVLAGASLVRYARTEPNQRLANSR